jgi:leucyl aminopeptidase
MQTRVVAGPLGGHETEALILAIFENGEQPLTGPAAQLDAALNGQLATILVQGDFKAKRNESLVLYPHGLIAAKRVILVGLGKQSAFSGDIVRQVAATAARKARELGAADLTVALGNLNKSGLSPRRVAEAIAEGALLGLYRFDELKTQLDDHRPDPKQLTLAAAHGEETTAFEEGLRSGALIAESANLTRNLVNRPANIATPSHLVRAAQEIAASTGLKCQILDKPDIEALGMHLLLSVNAGSGAPAHVVILEHNASRSDDLPSVVLVGKGITFDTGGISLKSGAGMERMKGDMAGAAAVLGAMRAAALLELPLHVVGLAPLTENMLDARGTKPGDIIRSLKGLTVEVVNTDAEGRLILADTLTYAGEFHPDAILDIATLTGSRITALGDHAAAVMGDDALIERLRAAGDVAGERVWPLPLFEEYAEQIDSDVADVKNVGGAAGGTIIGGCFLSKFVPDGVPWVHIDIAGLEGSEKARPYVPKGASGFGVRLLVEALRRWTD